MLNFVAQDWTRFIFKEDICVDLFQKKFSEMHGSCIDMYFIPENVYSIYLYYILKFSNLKIHK